MKAATPNITILTERNRRAPVPTPKSKTTVLTPFKPCNNARARSERSTPARNSCAQFVVKLDVHRCSPSRATKRTAVILCRTQRNTLLHITASHSAGQQRQAQKNHVGTHCDGNNHCNPETEPMFPDPKPEVQQYDANTV